jgi:hypothetical protein
MMINYIVRQPDGSLLPKTKAGTETESKFEAVKLFYCYIGTFESNDWVSSWIWLYNRGYRVIEASNVECLPTAKKRARVA